MRIQKGVYRELVKTDKHGNKVFRTNACKKCGGTGNLGYVCDNGRCWRCGGSGIEAEHHVTEYTPEQQRLRSMKATAKRVGSVADQLAAMGFNADGVAYRPVGDTFSVKDRIKACGGRWDRAHGWIVPKPLDFIECERLIASECTLIEEYVFEDEHGEQFKYSVVRWTI